MILKCWPVFELQPVANAINVLQACIYKSVNIGLFLKSLVATNLVKFNKRMLVFTLKYEVLELTNMILLKSATLAATNYF